MNANASLDGDGEELREAMIAVATEAGEPMEPWNLAREAADRADATMAEARRMLRLLTHGRREDRELVHILDGRVTCPE